MDANSIIAGASNLKGGDNPSFSIDDFLSFYPQFDLPELPSIVTNMFISIADTVVKETRWHSMWMLGMSLYVAHYCSLYLKTAQATGAQGVYGTSLPQGLQTSKSVDGVSVSYDYGTMSEDLKGWGDMGLTVFGQQYVSKARLLGKGGMAVH